MPKVLDVLFYPNPLLLKKATPVEEVTKEIQDILDDMLCTMYEYNGIGLAANQVGVLKRLIVIDLAIEEKKEPLFIINPEVTILSKELFEYNEGCLSLPKVYGLISRPRKIRLDYLDYNGKKQSLEAEDLLSTCIQHEVDHLNGILFFKHLSKLKREMLLKRYKKIKEEDSE